MKKTLRILLSLTVILSIAVLLFILINGYDASMNLFIDTAMGNNGINDDIRERLLASKISLLVHSVLFIFIILSGIVLIKFEAIYRIAARGIYYTKRAFLHVFKDMCTKEALIVCAVPVIAYIYFGLTFPVFLDETATAIHFVVEPPFYYSLTHYPAPNNHILHSLILNITEAVSPFDLLATIRIPVIVGSIFTCFLLFSFLKSYFRENTTLLIVGISSMLHYTVFYAFLSRGYYLVFLAFIICLYAVFNILKKDQKKDWGFFIISSIVGFYTMPSFLYVFIILNVILLFNIRNIKKIIISGAIVGVVTLLLYSPIIMLDGIEALINNESVKPLARMDVLSRLPRFYLNMISDVVGINGYIVISLLLITFVYLLKLKDKWKIYLFAVFVLAPFILLFLHSVIPFYRTFNYYGLVFVFLIVTAFSGYIDKFPEKYVLLFIICIQIGLFINFYSKRERPAVDYGYEYRWGNLYREDIADEDMSFYVNNWWFDCILVFEKTRRHQSTDNIYRDYSRDISADSLGNYNYIFLNPAYDRTALRKPDYSDALANIYINKKQIDQ